MHQFVKNRVDDDAGPFANELLLLRAIPGLSVPRIAGLNFILQRLEVLITWVLRRCTG